MQAIRAAAEKSVTALAGFPAIGIAGIAAMCEVLKVAPRATDKTDRRHIAFSNVPIRRTAKTDRSNIDFSLSTTASTRQNCHKPLVSVMSVSPGGISENFACLHQGIRYTRNVSETTDAGFSSLTCPRRITAAVRFFYVRTPSRASFNGWALAGRLRPAGSLGRRSANPVSCPPTSFSSGERVKPVQGGRIMRQSLFARIGQPEPQSPVQRFPLFARAGSEAANLWLAHTPLSAADFRDLRFRNLMSGLAYDVDDDARRVAFNNAFASRIASSIAEQSRAEVRS